MPGKENDDNVDNEGSTPLPDKKQLELILDKLQKKDTYGVYFELVVPEELPDYHEVIEHPLDFLTVRKKLSDGCYSTLEEFEVSRDFGVIDSDSLQKLQHKRPTDNMIIGNSSRSIVGDAPASPKYSDRLSPAINSYLSEASRQESHRTPENYSLLKVNSQLCSPSQPYSLREALAQAQSSRIGTSAHALRESLHPILRQKLELWEENLWAAVSLQVLEITEKFSTTAAAHKIATDY